MARIDLSDFDSFKNTPRWDAAVYRKLFLESSDQPLDSADQALFVDVAERLVERAQASGIVENIQTAQHNLALALALVSGDDERRKAALDEILSQKQSEGVNFTKKEQERLKEAQHNASPLKGFEDLVVWLRQAWENWVLPTLKAIKQMFDALWPLIRDTLEDLPRSLDIIRKDLIVPYLKACENWKDYVDKLADDLRHGPKAAAKDMEGMPYIPGPNLDVAEATKLKTAFMIPPVRAMALGTLAPLEMLERQSNTYRGFYGPVQYYSWLLSNEVGPDIGGLISDAFGIGRRAGRAVSGVGDALSGAGDTLGDIPEWFISNTVPKIDVATGKMDYYLY